MSTLPLIKANRVPIQLVRLARLDMHLCAHFPLHLADVDTSKLIPKAKPVVLVIISAATCSFERTGDDVVEYAIRCNAALCKRFLRRIATPCATL